MTGSSSTAESTHVSATALILNDDVGRSERCRPYETGVTLIQATEVELETLVLRIDKQTDRSGWNIRRCIISADSEELLSLLRAIIISLFDGGLLRDGSAAE